MTSFGRIVGTGGIGTGLIYRLDSNRSLGRNESRMATRLPLRDFCKQHIILHYLAVLLRDLRERVEVIPIGAVGDDAMGHELLADLSRADLSLDQVRALAGAPTMAAICYQFPDGSGGNLTEQHSACARVTPRFIERAMRAIGRPRGRLMVLAAPEVPLASRLRLLELGRRQQAVNAASFTVDELPAVRRAGALALVDLLAVNIDEAAALGGVSPGKSAAAIVAACLATVARRAPHLKLAITHGRHGAYAAEAGQRLFLPALKVKVANTAGAGDAFLAGLMLGLIRGLPFIATDRFCAARLGRSLAALSVTSPDTIHFGVNLRTLATFHRRHLADEPTAARAGDFLLGRA